MTSISMTDPHTSSPQQSPTPVAVQVLGMLLFAGFAIPVTIVTLNIFWPAGAALALIIGWRGTFAFGNSRGPSPQELAQMVQSLKPETTQPRTSSNSSFNAYRDDMLNRLEMEQESFEAFVDRLRDAKDKTEFDTFMDERARIQRDPE